MTATFQRFRPGWRARLGVMASLLILAACASAPPPPRGGYGGKPATGRPYQINGVWYYPKDDPNYNEVGYASWYGPGFHGNRTATGEIYDMNDMTAAHKTLPLPSFVRVTNLANGRSIILRVNDRGPFVDGRIIDVSRRAAQELDFYVNGTTKVRVQRVDMVPGAPGAVPPPPPEPEMPQVAAAPSGKVTSEALPPAGQPEKPAPTVAARPTMQEVDTSGREHKLFVQVGAFSNFENAARVEAKLKSMGQVGLSTVTVNGQAFYRVRVGPLANAADAGNALATVVASGYPEAKIVTE